jgi:hypothetical protein
MTIMIIPLQAIPSQSVSYTLNGIAYTADIESLRGNLYISVWQGGAYVLRNRALRSYAPVGFGLQLADTAGTDDPEYAGLGSRWILLGLEE